MQSLKKENGAFVEFYTDAVELTYRTEQEGRPIYEDQTHVRIAVPGDRQTIIERIATKDDYERFPAAYAAFQKNESQNIGTPLTKWPLISKSQAKEAEHFNVTTVEQMARLSDAHVQTMGMGFSDLRSRAQHYLSGEQRVDFSEESHAPVRAKPGPKPKPKDDAGEKSGDDE